MQLPNGTLTLKNGDGEVTFYTGDWIINGVDRHFTGNVFNQYRQIDQNLFDLMKDAKLRGGSDLAWKTYHEQVGQSLAQ